MQRISPGDPLLEFLRPFQRRPLWGKAGVMMTRQQQSNVEDQGVRSNLHIAGHPIHPILMPFPIALLTSAAVTDVVYLLNSDPFWARVSLWLIAGGFVSGVVAAAAGLVDFVTIERARAHLTGWIHFIGNALVLGLALWNWLPRIDNTESFISPWGLVLSLVTAGLLVITGWTGGELAYRHKIGVTGH